MNSEKLIKDLYNQYGKEYQEKRYSDYIEVPTMLKTVKNIKGKKLLDVGCGAGIHIKAYSKKGAKCFGIDISETMIAQAKVNNPKLEFKVGSVTKLPYKDNSFDIVASSLCLDHVKDLKKAIKEMSRVLKKGGYLYYSYKSPVSCLREYYEDKDYEIRGIGKFIDKRNNKVIYLGASGIIQNLSWISDNKLKVYNYPFQIHLKEMIKNNLELLDVVDCYPIKSYKNIDLEKYKQFSKYPLWVIYVCRKK